MSIGEGVTVAYQKFEYDAEDIEMISIMKMTLE